MKTRTPLVMANWKQHGSEAALTDWLTSVSAIDLPEICRVLCVPLPYLAKLRQQRAELQSQVQAGAQLVSAFRGGAYTGEVSAAMLSEFQVAYSLIGHSERRQWFDETASARRGQLSALWQAGITPVLCVGETALEHQQGQTCEVLMRQLAEVLDGQATAGPLVLAYEPVFAIGSGKPLSAQSAQQMHQQLRLMLKRWYSAADCQRIRILYGGSVNNQNAGEYLRQDDIDGVLVGSGSLQAGAFNALCHAVVHAVTPLVPA
ncbi:triose-phosphate isomerase [Rheinheimera tilapiae]|uniref:Triosephosphate isomerase n=1 Tax=Rheinheimera tilapiae TaxID=875043 RepID=A0ABV6BFQ0_9GAMM